MKHSNKKEAKSYKDYMVRLSMSDAQQLDHVLNQKGLPGATYIRMLIKQDLKAMTEPSAPVNPS